MDKRARPRAVLESAAKATAVRHVPPHRLLTPAPYDGQVIALDTAPNASALAAVVAAASELAGCTDLDSVLRLVVELARGDVGLERASLYLTSHDGDHMRLTGSWGTGIHGETIDERKTHHALSQRDHDALLNLAHAGAVGVYRPNADHVSAEHGRIVKLGTGWSLSTPVLAGRRVVGVLYNDSALSGRPVDEAQQAVAAVLCSVAGILIAARQQSSTYQALQPPGALGPLVARTIGLVKGDLSLSGELIAQRLGVSPSHLARRFKREMGATLVDYRNQLRFARFTKLVEHGAGKRHLLDAARDAGFGSYAQFNRVHRQLTGSSPSGRRKSQD